MKALLLALVVASILGAFGAFNQPPAKPAHHAKLPESSLCEGVEVLPCQKPLRERLIRAAEHLPPGASVEEMTVQAEHEAEAREAP